MAVSTALSISDIPFHGPVSIVRVGLVEDKTVLFPTINDQLKSQLDLLICHDSEGINMIEADANIVKNETVLEAMALADKTGGDINKQINEIVKKVGKIKVEFEDLTPTKQLQDEVEKHLQSKLKQFLADGAMAPTWLPKMILKKPFSKSIKTQLLKVFSKSVN